MGDICTKKDRSKNLKVGYYIIVIVLLSQHAGGMTGPPDYNPLYEVWEFDTVTGQWGLVDRMMQPRYQHTVTVVPDGEQFCTHTPQYLSLGTLLQFMDKK